MNAGKSRPVGHASRGRRAPWRLARAAFEMCGPPETSTNVTAPQKVVLSGSVGGDAFLMNLSMSIRGLYDARISTFLFFLSVSFRRETSERDPKPPPSWLSRQPLWSRASRPLERASSERLALADMLNAVGDAENARGR